MLVMVEEKYQLGTLKTEEVNRSFKPTMEKLENPTSFVDVTDCTILI